MTNDSDIDSQIGLGKISLFQYMNQEKEFSLLKQLKNKKSLQ